MSDPNELLQKWITELENAKDDEEREWIGKFGGNTFGKKNYLQWLWRLHNAVRPENYLEIGVADGGSLRLAMPPTLAIGVDPEPHTTGAFDTDTIIYAMTSDRFFLNYTGPYFDMAFIDGLHLFEQALRDFINVESCSRLDGLILLHDIMPVSHMEASREKKEGMWAGDVWKLIPILEVYRPDIHIDIIDCQPTGLAVISDLDPDSRTLNDAYDKIVKDWMEETYPRHRAGIAMKSSWKLPLLDK